MFEDRIDYFVLAYESPNFSAAAARIPMSPQGLSKAIRNLEKELGVVLFATDAAGQRTPTPYADRLYDYATSIRRERAALMRSFDELSNKGAFNFEVPTSLGIVGLIGDHLKEAFRERCPEVQLTLIEMPDDDCESFIRQGRYHCGLLVSPARGDLVFHEVYATHLCLWVRGDNPLFAKDRLTFADLFGQTLAMPGHGFKCYQQLIARMDDEGLEPPAIIERSELMWIYEEVARGRALGFSLPYMSGLAAFSCHDNIRPIALEGSRWGFGVVHDKAPAESSYEAIFEQCVADCAQRLTM
ncbi:LysR family transcriptional regulator [Adlercreutzia equolifaciens]|uniref:LysR family transcriptional regulator n=1 Tax=Adlercreutzia equolifaciens TaxID=446660 RepID=UPI0026DABE39|nr:LysR family transcriptional regulator [Adlercreutzia equolifaciens]